MSTKEIRMKSLLLTLAIGMLATPMMLQTAYAGDAGSPAVPTQPAPDNSKTNMRDRDPATLTPMDQGGSEADRTITQQIRKAVVGQDGFSTDAKNVKIITQDGVVTLRGSVKSAEEKATIAAVSTKTEGVKRVDNQLEVAAQH
jgi:hypothetical protein